MLTDEIYECEEYQISYLRLNRLNLVSIFVILKFLMKLVFTKNL